MHAILVKIMVCGRAQCKSLMIAGVIIQKSFSQLVITAVDTLYQLCKFS